MRVRTASTLGGVSGLGYAVFNASSVKDAVTTAVVSVVAAATAFAVGWLQAHTPARKTGAE